MTQEPGERKAWPAYRSETLTYRQAFERLGEDGYSEVERDGHTESLQTHLARLDGDLAPEAENLVRLEPSGEALLPDTGSWLREEPERAPPPDELDLPLVVDVFRVREGGEEEYLNEEPFARVRRHAPASGGPLGAAG